MKNDELNLRVGCYSEISINDFYEWLIEKYFKSPPYNTNLYLDKYDVDIVLTLNEQEKIISFSWELIDTTDTKNKLSENLKRELREVTRGEVN